MPCRKVLGIKEMPLPCAFLQKGKHFLDETCFATTFMRYKEQRQINLLTWSIQKREFDEFRTEQAVYQ